MKRKYLKDMDVNEQLDIIINNNTLINKFEELYYSMLMDLQQEETELTLGKHTPGVEIKDHYSSFYLQLTNWELFFTNLDKDYLSPQGIELYNELKELNDKYINEEDSDIYSELYEKAEEKSKDLLQVIEDQLHEYEHYSEEDMKEELKYHIENGDYENCYIIDNDKNVVYEDITKIYR